MVALSTMKRIDYHIPFYPDTFYHIYNRGNNSGSIFFTEKHYSYFLKKWTEYLDGVLEVYAYCLLPNHFHFLVKTKGRESDITSQQRDTIPQRDGISGQRDGITGDYEVVLENKLRRMLQSFSQAINKDVKRTGSLFQKRYKRLIVKDENYLQWLTYYIHKNPFHHGYVKDLKLWKYSSFNTISDTIPSRDGIAGLVKVDELISFFGSRNNFLEFHNQIKMSTDIEHLTLE